MPPEGAWLLSSPVPTKGLKGHVPKSGRTWRGVYQGAVPSDTGHCALPPQGGMYWLVLLDDYSAGFGLMVVVITTCLVVTRVYGKGVCPHRGMGKGGLSVRREGFRGSSRGAISLAMEHETPLFPPLVSSWPSLDSPLQRYLGC